MSVVIMFNRIDAFEDKECGAGADAEEISAAERSLGVAFPQSYRSFLGKFGWGGWGRFSYFEFNGLGPDVPRHLDVVRITLAERFDLSPQMPQRLIPLMNDGAGNNYCLDTDAFKGDECPIVFWDHEQGVDQTPESVASSFDSWIVQVLDGRD